MARDMQKEWNNSLLQGIRDGNLSTIEKCLKKGADIHATDNCRRSTLTLAIEGGHVEIVEYLLSRGVILDAARYDFDGYYPLTHSLEKGHIDIAKFLISRGADVCKRDRNRNNALSYAIKMKNPQLAELLFSHGANLTMQTSFLEAIESKCLEIVEIFIKNGVDVNFIYRHGRTPLSEGLKIRDVKIVEELIKNGAEVNTQNSKGDTPLIVAVNISKIPLELIELLVKSGANINIVGESKRSPLMHALSMQRFDIVKYIVERGGDVNHIDEHGETPLSIAANCEDIRSFQYLLDNGANFNLLKAKIGEMVEKSEDFDAYIKLLNKKKMQK